MVIPDAPRPPSRTRRRPRRRPRATARRPARRSVRARGRRRADAGRGAVARAAAVRRPRRDAPGAPTASAPTSSSRRRGGSSATPWPPRRASTPTRTRGCPSARSGRCSRSSTSASTSRGWRALAAHLGGARPARAPVQHRAPHRRPVRPLRAAPAGDGARRGPRGRRTSRWQAELWRRLRAAARRSPAPPSGSSRPASGCATSRRSSTSPSASRSSASRGCRPSTSPFCAALAAAPRRPPVPPAPVARAVGQGRAALGRRPVARRADDPTAAARRATGCSPPGARTRASCSSCSAPREHVDHHHPIAAGRADTLLARIQADVRADRASPRARRPAAARPRRPQHPGPRLPRPRPPGRGPARRDPAPARRRPDARAARRHRHVPGHRDVRAADPRDVRLGRGRRRRGRRRAARSPPARPARAARRPLAAPDQPGARRRRPAARPRRPAASPPRRCSTSPTASRSAGASGFDDDDLARLGDWVARRRHPLGPRRRAPRAVQARAPAPPAPGARASTACCVGVTMTEDEQPAVRRRPAARRRRERRDRPRRPLRRAGRPAAGRASTRSRTRQADRRVGDGARRRRRRPDRHRAARRLAARASSQRLLDDVVDEARTAPTPTSRSRSPRSARCSPSGSQGRPTRANFRTGHLTICTLVPMRSVPHRVVCLLGLDDGVFPRKAPRDGDDLMLARPARRRPRPAQRGPPAAARRAAGRDATGWSSPTPATTSARTRRARPPSRSASCSTSSTARSHGRRPRARPRRRPAPAAAVRPAQLHARRARADAPWSFDRVDARTAPARWPATAHAPRPFLAGPLPAVAGPVVELDDLVRFVAAPVRAFLRQRLGISVARLRRRDRGRAADRARRPRAVAASAPTARRAPRRRDAAGRRRAEIARGTLPPGALGQPVIDDGPARGRATIVGARRACSTCRRAGSVDVRVALADGRTLSGTVPGVGGDAPARRSPTRASARSTASPRGCACSSLTAAHPERGFTGVTVGRGRRRSRRVTARPGSPPLGDRRRLRSRYLAVLVDLTDRGPARAAADACKTSHAYARRAARPIANDGKPREWARALDRRTGSPSTLLAGGGRDPRALLARRSATSASFGTVPTARASACSPAGCGTACSPTRRWRTGEHAADVRPFDVCGPLPTGVTVLEASAGTGKTYTIAALAARYVADGHPARRAPARDLHPHGHGRAARTRPRAASCRPRRDPTRRARRPARPTTTSCSSCCRRHRRRGRRPPRPARRRARRLRRRHHRHHPRLLPSRSLSGLGVVGDVEHGSDVTSRTSATSLEEVVDDLYVRRFAGKDEPPPFSRRRGAARSPAPPSPTPRRRSSPPRPTDQTTGRRCGRRLAGAVRERARPAQAASAAPDLRRPAHAPRRHARRSGDRRVRRREAARALHGSSWSTSSRTPTRSSGTSSAARRSRRRRAHARADRRPQAGDLRLPRRRRPRLPRRRRRRRRPARRWPTNWRSDQDLLAALRRAVRRRPPRPRRASVYRRSRPPPRTATPRLHGAPVDAALRIRVVQRASAVGAHAAGLRVGPERARARRRATSPPTSSRLLSSDARSGAPTTATTGRRRLRPGDIAVLVRTNTPGDARARRAAPRRRARRHQRRRQRLRHRAARGVAAPARGARAPDLGPARAARRPHAVPGLDAPSRWPRPTTTTWESVHRRLHGWARVLRTRGVASLLEVDHASERLPERVLAHVDGERRLTDLRHVGQLLHARRRRRAARHHRAGGLAARPDAAPPSRKADEERTRRLESDADAVQVLTIHRSKGLEFPIVYCPFLWDPMWPDDERRPGRLPRRRRRPRKVDVALEGSDYAAHRRARTSRRKRGEELRLAYVALTRARHQAVIWWAGTRDTRTSPLSRLAFAREEDGTVPASRRRARRRRRCAGGSAALAARRPGASRVEDA